MNVGLLVIAIATMALLMGSVNAEVISAQGSDKLNASIKISCETENVPPEITGYNFDVHRTYPKIPYSFTGESITFNIDVNDNNGADDIRSASIVLSEDDAVSPDDITIELDNSFNVNETCKEYTGTYTVKSSDYGLRYIIAVVEDLEGSKAEKLVGKVFLNPKIGVEIPNLTTIDFGVGKPGEISNATVTIKNVDPDGVGLKLDVYIKPDSLTNGYYTIPPEYIKCNGITLNTNFEKIATIAPNETLTLNLELIRPIPLPAGKYTGNLEIKFIAK